MENNEELDIVNICKTFWNKKYIMAIIIAVTIVIEIIYTFAFTKPMYKTTSKIVIDKSDASIAESLPNSEVLKQVANELQKDFASISQEITAQYDKATKTIEIEVQNKNSEDSYNITTKYQELLKTSLEEDYQIQKFDIVEEPQLQEKAYNINHIKDILVSLAIGIVLDIIYLFVLLNLSGISNCEQIENLGLISLGKIYEEKTTENHITENEKQINELKKIMTNIELNKISKNPKTVLFTSINEKDGTSYAVSNLAVRFAIAGKKVLVIDSNFNNETQYKIFDMRNTKGLKNCIKSNNVTHIQETKINNVSLLSSGDSNINEEILLSENTAKVLEELKQKYDIILIDSGSVINNISSTVWTTIVDSTILVTKCTRTRQKDIMQAKTTIENVNGKIAGVIINKYM